ncbi:component of IIS longevity pathway SMK-1-domain-containing protein [Cryomyces antarcticus]
MALAAPPVNDRKRVKVYELRNNDWYDRGTGFCVGQVLNQEDARIYVESEDEPGRSLLDTKISKDDGYQKQQDTLIVWTEQDGVDMALSFQEAEGCGVIWDFISEVQQRLTVLHGPDDGLSDDVIDTFNTVMLPPPDLKNLAEIEAMMRTASSSPPGRDALAKFIMNQESLYIPKLVPLLEIAEDLESLPDLHRLCNIMKTLILLNDTAIIEFVVTDEVILGVVGALEYDPDFPSHKANHRQYLSDESKFKEVVKIENPDIKRKIHYTYRLQYLKDVVLARILDDPTFSVLNSLIFFHQVDIVQHLQSNAMFLTELFSIFGPQETDKQRQKDAVLFIGQCCAVAKNIQAGARAQLYQNLINGGLFNVITFALRHQDAAVRVAGTDVLVAMIDHDPLMMRSHVFKAISEREKPLTDTLIELLLVEVDLGVKAQMADAIKVLLDPNANTASVETLGRTNAEFSAKLRSITPTALQTETFIQNFYDESAKKLFQPLKDLEYRESMDNLSVQEVSLYSHLVEVLCFFVRQHAFRSKFFVLTEGLASRVAQLMSCPQKHLKLTALKYFRACIQLNDEFHNRQLIQNNLFEPILNLVYETMPRDNLLNSACLELFEFVKRENVKAIIFHVVENYRDKLKDITYVNTFQSLILKYDQIQSGYPAEGDQSFATSFTTQEADTPNRGVINGGQRWQGLKDTDAEEEAYFNGSDGDDEDDGSLPTAVKPATNGISPLRPLVNYPDDEEDAMDILASPSTPGHEVKGVQSPSPTTQALTVQSPRTPPERLSEKRRREEDEEDELGKMLTHPKRRSSVSSVSSTDSTASAHGHMLRKKKSINAGKDGPPKKIAISLAMKSGGNGANNESGD